MDFFLEPTIERREKFVIVYYVYIFLPLRGHFFLDRGRKFTNNLGSFDKGKDQAYNNPTDEEIQSSFRALVNEL